MKKILGIIVLLAIFAVPFVVFAGENPQEDRMQNITLRNITQEVVKTFVDLYIDKINKKPGDPALRITSPLDFTFESKKSVKSGSGKIHTVEGHAHFDFIGKDNIVKVGEVKFKQIISEDALGKLRPKELASATVKTIK